MRVSASFGRGAWVLLLPVWLGLSNCSAPARGPSTIADLPSAADVPVQTAAPLGPDPSHAMSNYQQFLQMQNADPALRAEAMRRLADLNLESGELERMSGEVSRLDARGADAIRLYTTLLKAYPN